MNTDKAKTLDYLDGIWGLKDGDHHVHVDISPNKVCVEHKDEKFEFENHGSWQQDGQVLVFNSTPYFVKKADETHIIFGKYRSDVLPEQVEWQHTLERVGDSAALVREHESCKDGNENLHDLREML